MIEIKGKYSCAKVFTDKLDDSAMKQLKTLCTQEFCKDAKIRIMPDVHAGAGCVIGFTANLGKMVIPNIVGVDIGCGIITVALGNIDIDFIKLDEIINGYVPSGRSVHAQSIVEFEAISNLNCYTDLKNIKHFEKSIGTLGGGNHFIEINVDDEDNKYLVIHTGSRNLGKQIAEIYQQLAIDTLSGKDKYVEAQQDLISQYKSEGKEHEIQAAIDTLKQTYANTTLAIPEALCYLTDTNRDMYLQDMKICQAYATINRKTIANIIIDKLLGDTLNDYEYFETVHNYIDLETDIVRKGAVSAKENEKILIPINMRDGSLLCIGKGNEEWNCSAPHGAGRLFSRTKAKSAFTIEEFQGAMSGIYSTSISEDTLDECPMAYKDMSDIVNNIGPTADIVKILKPVYNFKAND